ncbi:orotate phosphoribosyltransferase [Phragmitibacter flavus]|uniref:Orotate phosphoribosyltransferase n=1 Tax=Phragmitibacter flavus TaxID=2576071 RepID=A0A5R8KH08_9BACT|nr:orotate phosphoribosyltransferase [Phragmitibacter flavus]TLD71604.1 orotate phosphoribosyltransferase [Phragmitibacter flavus]
MPTLPEATELLRELLLKKSVMRGDFTLASGAKSDLYVDCRLTTLDAAGGCLVGQVMHALLRKAEEETGVKVAAVGGLTMGADPVALSAAMFSHLSDDSVPVPAYSVRKAAKDHGRKKLVEGNFKAGDVVAVVDDVITTGGSTIKAIEQVEAEGGKIGFVLVLLDREEGGKANIEARGVKVFSAFTRSSLLG